MPPQIHKIYIKPHTHKHHTSYAHINSHIHIFYIQIEHVYNTTHNIIATTQDSLHTYIYITLHMYHQTSHTLDTHIHTTITQTLLLHTNHISHIPRTHRTDHIHTTLTIYHHIYALSHAPHMPPSHHINTSP